MSNNAARESPAEEVARLRGALSESERSSLLLVDSIPGLVALLAADGQLQFVNRQILEYTGRTLEELKQWGTGDTVHPGTSLTSLRSSHDRSAPAVRMKSCSGFGDPTASIVGSRTAAFRFVIPATRSFAGASS